VKKDRIVVITRVDGGVGAHFVEQLLNVAVGSFDVGAVSEENRRLSAMTQKPSWAQITGIGHEGP
jgi:hypothetical protein